MRAPAKTWDLNVKRNFRARVRTEIVESASGIAVKISPWTENLCFDNALSFLVSTAASFAGLFAHLKIGSGTTANSFAGGAITFTQVGTTITASGAFFTAGMVGSIFKYGTGTSGAEQYIATVAGGGLSCTVTGAGLTVATPTVATVWMVQQTALQTWLANSTGYQTNTGDNSTVIAGAAITLQRTFLFATPGSTQNINEIGYSDNSTADGSCRGRIVLPSTDVVDTSHFYRVVMQLSVTVAPVTPTAASNVGTNIDTTGTVVFEYYDFQAIGASGVAAAYQNSGVNFMDGGTSTPWIGLRIGTWSQPANTQTGTAPVTGETFNLVLANFSTSGQPLGQSISTTNFSWTTAGQTLNGFGLAYSNSGIRDVWTLKLTTPVTLPTGTFQGSLSVTKVFTRTLTN